MDLIHRYGERYRLLCVCDATMSPSELLLPGGATEARNDEPGLRWLERLVNAFPRHAWLNPEPEASWPGKQTVQMIRQTLRTGMYPLTMQGIGDAMRRLVRCKPARNACRPCGLPAAGLDNRIEVLDRGLVRRLAGQPLEHRTRLAELTHLHQAREVEDLGSRIVDAGLLF